MAEPIRISNARVTAWYVVETGEDIIIPCKSYAQVQSLVSQLNKWRQQVLETHPELEELSFKKRKSPPEVEIEYNSFIHNELMKKDRTPLGVSIADLKEQDRQRQEEEFQEQARREMEQVSDEEQFHYAKKLADAQGHPVKDILPERLMYMLEDSRPEENEPEERIKAAKENLQITPEIQQALDEARRQQNRELTDTEEYNIIHSMQPIDHGSGPII